MNQLFRKEIYFDFFMNLLNFLIIIIIFTCTTPQKKGNEKDSREIINQITSSLEEPQQETNSHQNEHLNKLIKKLENSEIHQLKLEDVIQLTIYNSNKVKLQKLELLKADTDILKEESKYAPILDFKYQGYEKVDKLLPQSIFQGTKINQDTYSIGIQKLFETGTFFRIEGSDTRFDSNAGENALALTNPILQQLRQPPLHTGAIKIIFQQDLLKNAFGYSQKRLKEIAQKKSLIQKEQLEYQLAGLIVLSLIDYWNFAIAEQEVKAARALLNNVTNIRNITVQKLQLGLAEPFELNQWNALYSQAEISVNIAELNKEQKRRDLLRNLNLRDDVNIISSTELMNSLPNDLEPKKDLEFALQTRQDYKAIQYSYEIARMGKDLTENNLMPTVRIGGQYATRDFGRYPYSAWDQVPSFKYPEKAIQFSVEYPLWDEGAKVNARNAEISLKQLEIQKQELERQIKDEIEIGYKQVLTAFDSLKKAEIAYNQTNQFYFGLLNGYRRGRFNVTAIKNALDALVQAEKGYNQALINYNIILVRYDLLRNKIFEKYKINIKEIVNKLK